MLDWLGDEGGSLMSAFVSVFGGEPQPFGSAPLQIGGVSDGARGVQWNLSFDPRNGQQRIAVNLEGMQYSGWPVARLILNELETPQLLRLRHVDTPATPVVVWWRRDHWQYAARPRILEHDIQPTPTRLGELTEDSWRKALCDALGCLEGERSRQGRATQTVTRAASGSRVAGEVSPHLQILYDAARPEPWDQFVLGGRTILQPIYDWAVRQTQG
jgi:hypothetical protein